MRLKPIGCNVESCQTIAKAKGLCIKHLKLYGLRGRFSNRSLKEK